MQLTEVIFKYSKYEFLQQKHYKNANKIFGNKKKLFV